MKHTTCCSSGLIAGFALFLLLLPSNAVMSQDPNDAFWDDRFNLPGISGTVHALARDNDGNVYAGGTFSVAGKTMASNIAMWNGTSWESLGDGTNNTVYALAIDTDDNLYAGGIFTSAGGNPASKIAMWNGITWSALGAGVNSTVTALTVNNADTVFVGGSFTEAGGASASNIARWDGSNWHPAGGGVNNNVRALAADASGNVYAGGDFTEAEGSPANRIAKWNGNSWSALGDGLDGTVYGIATFGSDVYAAGSFNNSGTDNLDSVGIWDGVSWNEVGSGRVFTCNDVSVDPAENVYVAGPFTSDMWNGIQWVELGGGIDTSANTVETCGTECAFFGGTFAYAKGVGDSDQKALSRIGQWNSDAWHAMPEGQGTNNTVSSLISDNEGNLYTGGSFQTAGNTEANYVAVWDGSGWNSLGSGATSSVFALALDGAENLYAAKSFEVIMWDGSTWSALGSGLMNSPNALCLNPNDSLYAAGSFTTAGGVSAERVAVWDGASWAALGDGLSGTVYALACADNGDVYAGGSFTMSGTTPIDRIAKWDGSSWSEVGGGVNGTVRALTIGPDGSLYAGGAFSQANEAVVNSAAKWNGVAWEPLGSGFNAAVYALAFDEYGMLFAGGDFTTADGQPANRIAAWKGESWVPLGSGVNSRVNAIASGSLWIGGLFTRAGDEISYNIARFDNSILPIEIADFHGYASGQVVELTWTAPSDPSNSGFEIQYTRRPGADSRERAWETVGFVSGARWEGQGNRYTYTVGDMMPGVVWFRLKQIDMDGAFSFSEIIELDVPVTSAHGLSPFYPNPFHQRSQAFLSVATDQHVSVTLHDLLGRTVMTLFDDRAMVAAPTRIAISGDHLSAGTYVIRVVGRRFLQERSLIILP